MRCSAKAVGDNEARNSLSRIAAQVSQRRQANHSTAGVADSLGPVSLSRAPAQPSKTCPHPVTFPLPDFNPCYLNYHPKRGSTNEEGVGTTMVNIILNNNNYIIISLSYNNM